MSTRSRSGWTVTAATALGCAGVLWAGVGHAGDGEAPSQKPTPAAPAAAAARAKDAPGPAVGRSGELPTKAAAKADTVSRGKGEEASQATAEGKGSQEETLGKTADGDAPAERGGVHGEGRGRHPARAQAIDAYRAALRAAREEAAPGSDAHRAALEKAREQLLEVHRGAKKPLPPAAQEAREKKLTALLEKVRKDRDARRASRVAELEKKHGDRLTSPPVRNELLRHAWRVARLERLAQIAEAEGREEQLARAKELLEKEREKHAERLAKLETVPAGTPGAEPAAGKDKSTAGKAAEKAAPGKAPADKASPAKAADKALQGGTQ